MLMSVLHYTIEISVLLYIAACYVFGYFRFLCELQSDDIKLSNNQSDYWGIFPVSDDVAIKHG